MSTSDSAPRSPPCLDRHHVHPSSGTCHHVSSLDDDLPGTPPCPPRQCDSPRLTWRTLVTRTPRCPPPPRDSQRLVFRTPVVERSPIKLTRSAFDDATQLKSVVERTLRKHSGFTSSGWWIPQIWARLAIRCGIRHVNISTYGSPL